MGGGGGERVSEQDVSYGQRGRKEESKNLQNGYTPGLPTCKCILFVLCLNMNYKLLGIGCLLRS